MSAAIEAMAIFDDLAAHHAVMAELVKQRDALLIVARDFDEVMRERDLRCECGETDCRTTRLDAALAQALTPEQAAQGDQAAERR